MVDSDDLCICCMASSALSNALDCAVITGCRVMSAAPRTEQQQPRHTRRPGEAVSSWDTRTGPTHAQSGGRAMSACMHGGGQLENNKKGGRRYLVRLAVLAGAQVAAAAGLVGPN